jgi:hypothetical protein
MMPATAPPYTPAVWESRFSAFINDPESPALNHDFLNAVGFDVSQRSKMDEVLRRACEEYLQAEKKHTHRQWGEDGQLLVTVDAFLRDLGRIERKFWQQLDKIATSELQRSRARTALNRYSALFPFGKRPEAFAIWTAGGSYHWVAGEGPVYSGRQLPRAIARFWKQPDRAEVEPVEGKDPDSPEDR